MTISSHNPYPTSKSSPPTHHSTDSALTQKSLTEIFDHHQPEAVMHLAAESHVDRSIDGPGVFIQTNIVGTYHLLQASLAYWRSLPAAGEYEGAKVARCEGVESLSPQISALSSHPSQKSFRFLHVSTDEVYGKGENIRDWLYVEDHCEALHVVLTQGRVGETYNIGGNNEKQNIELVKLLCEIMDGFRGQEAGGQKSEARGQKPAVDGQLLERFSACAKMATVLKFVTH